MSIATEISRLQDARNTIRDKLVALGLAEETAKLDELAEIIDSIVDQGAVNKTLSVTETSFDIEAGYHDGSGRVSITTETKTATPTRAVQDITPSNGKVLSKVTVNPIPDSYHNTSAVTATAPDVLANKVIINAEGEPVTGTMPNNGAVRGLITPRTEGHAYSIPVGYHDGNGYVMINVEDTARTVTPSREDQYIFHSEQAFIKQVIVKAISDNLQDVSGVTAAAENVLEDTFFVDSFGIKREGAMPNNGDTSTTMDGLTTTSVTIPAGYTSGGTVSLTNDIETALAAI